MVGQTGDPYPYGENAARIAVWETAQNKRRNGGEYHGLTPRQAYAIEWEKTQMERLGNGFDALVKGEVPPLAGETPDAARGLTAGEVILDEAQRIPSETQLPKVAPAGVWVDVPKGFTTAVGVIPHPDQERYPGVLVMEDDHTAVVRWHNKGCERRGTLDPAKVKFDRNGAPWCPTCFAENLHRNPHWNDEPSPGVPVPDPVASPPDPHARNRKALESGRFREPVVEELKAGGEVVGHRTVEMYTDENANRRAKVKGKKRGK